MDGQLRELLQFLRDRNPQVRQLALENLLPQTPPGSPHRNIFFTGLQGGGLQTKGKESDVIRDLKLLCRDTPAIAHDAFRALVNLSDSPLLLTPLSDPQFVTFLISYIINPQSVLADLASMLLSNLTASANACSALLTAKVLITPTPSLSHPFYATQSRCATSPPPDPYPTGETKEVLALPLLLDAFVQGAEITEDLSKRKRKATLHFLASVFGNISVSLAGRTFFLTPHPTNPLLPPSDNELEYPLAKILPFTEHPDTIRRGGVASTIKNCTFIASAHKAILSPDTAKIAAPPSTISAPGLDALQYILLPLAGPEEFELEDQEKLPEALQFLPPTKKREPDPTLRLTHVETLLLFCHTRWGRDFLREHGVYEIVRAAHLEEKADKVSEHIERLVQLLKGDEPKKPSALEESNVIVPRGQPGGAKAIEDKKDEEEDEDDIIQEV